MHFKFLFSFIRSVAVVFLSALLLTACGGGGSGAVDPTQDGGNNGTDPVTDGSQIQTPNAPADYDGVYEEDNSNLMNIPMLPMAMFASDPPGSPTSALPKLERKNWGIEHTGAHWAHWATCVNNCAGVSSGYLRGAGVTIGIVDTGIDINHVDMAPNIVLPDNQRPVLRQDETDLFNFLDWLYAEGYGVDRSDEMEYDLELVYGGNVTVHVHSGAVTVNCTFDLLCNGSEVIITAGQSYVFGGEDGEAFIFGGNTYYGPLDGVYGLLNSSHGTHVAGIAAGAYTPLTTSNPNRGAVGVAPEAKILPLTWLNGLNDLELEQAYSYATANDVFVTNNSWGYRNDYVQVTIETPLMSLNALDSNRNPINTTISNTKLWLEIPSYYYFDEDVGGIVVESPTNDPWATTINEETDDMLIVFARGNDGWNSETGLVPYCTIVGPAGGCAGERGFIRLGAPDIDFAELTVFGFWGPSASRPHGGNNYAADTFQGAVINPGENLGDRLNAAPERDPLLADIQNRWLNVVAVDDTNTIASFSNGCGETKHFCLAGPGVAVTSSVPGGNWNDNTAGNSGTSMGAPHVSGLAALLKGAFPSITAEQVQDIILYSADGLGDCMDVLKSVYCVDDVYGHGMMNVQAAFTPINNDFDAGSNEFSRRSLDDSRIGLSAPFGPSAWRSTSINIGMYDDFGRVFYSNLNLDDGIVIGAPTLNEDENEVVGMRAHAAFGSPLHDSTAPSFHYNRAADSILQEHDTLVAGGEHFSFARSYYGGYVGYNAAYEFGSGDVLAFQHHSGDSAHIPAKQLVSDFYKPGFVVEERDNVQYTHLGRNTQFAVMYENGDATQHLATRLTYGHPRFGMFAEGGMVREDDTVLGATFSGIFQTEQARTHYQRIGFNYHLPQGAQFYADYLQAQTTAGETSGIVRSFRSASDSFSTGLSFGGWDLSYTQPLSITDGSWQWEYENGYNSVGSTDIDLAAEKRERIYSLHYTGSGSHQQTQFRYAIGVDYINNAAAKGYDSDLLNLSTAIKARF